MRANRRAEAVAALVATIALVVGVPMLLLLVVGNPWPGSSRLAMGDEAALVVGVLAVLVWLVWLRFVVAVAVEVRVQLAERRAAADPHAAPRVPAPPPARAGAGLIAQRLVAAALVLLPVASPRVRAEDATQRPVVAATVAATSTAGVPATAPLAPTAVSTVEASTTVTVVDGDTLIGLARAHLGDPARWREIFELNRERPQLDGGRLSSPSLIRTGWQLELPAAAPPGPPAAVPTSPPVAAVAPTEVEVVAGDTMWDLARAHLRAAGLAADDVAVADYVHEMATANRHVAPDPDLIHVGERLVLPAIGVPPSPTVAPAAATPPPAVAPVEVPPDDTATAPPAEPAPAERSPTTSAPAPAESGPTAPLAADPPPAPQGVVAPPGSPSPIGVGEAALLSAGVLTLLASRRSARLRRSRPRSRVPAPPPDAVAAERKLRAVDAGERLLRVDIAVRAAAATLVVGGAARVTTVVVGPDGTVTLALSAAVELPAPWVGHGATWTLPGVTPVELLADAARSVGAPCATLAQLGVTPDGGDVLVDLEALGVLAVAAEPVVADAVVRGVAATLAVSVFAEAASLIGVAVDAAAFLGHRHAHAAASVEEALELAASLVGATAAARQSTFLLRARHTSGEAWEPVVVLVGSGAADDVPAVDARGAVRRGAGLALVVGAPLDEAAWTLRRDDQHWVLDPLGLVLVPVGLGPAELAELEAVLAAADATIDAIDAIDTIDDDAAATPPAVAVRAESAEPTEAGESDPGAAWSLMVRMLGPVDVVDAAGRAATFERSKALELVAWLSMHRERATRAGARTALWAIDVRDTTFANVVSEARRALARLVAPPAGEEWLGRTLTEVLPLHGGVVTDADVVRARLDAARRQPPGLAIATLTPAVALIRDVPFAGTGYLWPDAEGIQSDLVLLATSAATELAAHHLSMGDVDGVFLATGQGLRVLPGHEELIALRMRAHAQAGDLAGVRHEWESYERVLDADPWGDGEPAAKLVLLRRELLS